MDGRAALQFCRTGRSWRTWVTIRPRVPHATAPPTMTASAQTEQAHCLRLHVAPITGDDVPPDECIPKLLQLPPLRGGMDDGRPERHEDRRIAGRGETEEPSQRVQRAVGVA